MLVTAGHADNDQSHEARNEAKKSTIDLFDLLTDLVLFRSIHVLSQFGSSKSNVDIDSVLRHRPVHHVRSDEYCVIEMVCGVLIKEGELLERYEE